MSVARAAAAQHSPQTKSRSRSRAKEHAPTSLYQVRIGFGSISSLQVWDSSEPFSLGFPTRWALEKTHDGYRLRDMRTFSDRWSDSLIHEFPSGKNGAPARFRIPGANGAQIEITPLTPVVPLFSFNSPNSGSQELHVFSCMGSWTIAEDFVQSVFTARVDGKEVFSIEKKGSSEKGFWLKVHDPGLMFEISGGSHSAREGALGGADLQKSVLRLGTRSWRFRTFESSSYVDAPSARIKKDPEAREFRKTSLGAFGAIALLILTAVLWPKPKEEILPEEFAKIVLTRPVKTVTPKENTAQSQPKQDEKNPVTQSPKVNKSAVAQAFRAQALQSAVGGLLKGGMTSLMSQADFVAGGKANGDLAKFFNESAAPMKGSPGPGAGYGKASNTKVGMIGGGGATGYTQGERAAVKGQGGDFVALDTSGSFVDEGLSKDEVGEVIHKHMSEVRYCYESTLIHTPQLEGKLQLSFTIGPSGSVTTASVKSSTVPDPRLDDCVLRRLMTWKFPNPKGGVNVDVTYPFLFKKL